MFLFCSLLNQMLTAPHSAKNFLKVTKYQACITLLCLRKCPMHRCFPSKQHPSYLTTGNSRHKITTWISQIHSVLSYPSTGVVSTYKLQCVTDKMSRISGTQELHTLPSCAFYTLQELSYLTNNTDMNTCLQKLFGFTLGVQHDPYIHCT